MDVNLLAHAQPSFGGVKSRPAQFCCCSSQFHRLRAEMQDAVVRYEQR